MRVFVSRTELRAHKSLPVPPYQKFIYFLFLINVVEEVEDGVVEPFGIGDGISSREYGRGRQREANLYCNCKQEARIYAVKGLLE
jgi:hypothetical protein